MNKLPVSQPVQGLLASEAFSYSLFPQSPTVDPRSSETKLIVKPKVSETSIRPLNSTTAARLMASSALATTGLVGCHSNRSDKTALDHTNALQTATLIVGLTSLFLGACAVFLAARRNGFTQRINVPDFFDDLSERIARGNLTPAIGRREAYDTLRDRFHSDDDKITVIIGPKGCGKGHFLFGLAHEILRKRSIPEFDANNTLILEVTLKKLLGFKDFSHFAPLNAKMRQFDEKVKSALQQGKKVILIVDTFQRISSTGAIEGNANDHMTLFYTKLREWRKNPKIHLLGAISEENFRQHIVGTDIEDDIFPFHLSELDPESVTSIVTQRIEEWNDSRVRILPDAITRAVVLGNRSKKLINPQAAINLLEAAKNRASRMAMDAENNQYRVEDKDGKHQWVVNAALVTEIAQDKPFQLATMEETDAEEIRTEESIGGNNGKVIVLPVKRPSQE